MHIEIQKLIAEIETLAHFSEVPAPCVTRVLYSKEDQQSREWLRKLMQDAGLFVKEDALGNMFGRWEGQHPELPAVATGSHTDAIPYSGKYDGVVGVLGAIEAIRALRRENFYPKRSIDVIQFTAEEPTRFGIGCLGSRAMAGSLQEQDILALRDQEGNDINQLRESAGYSGAISDVVVDKKCYHSFIELHIEQGPRLEDAGLDIGIVTAIAAPATLKFTIKGEGGHAGAVLMPRRKDALIPATKVIQEIEAAAKTSDSQDAVATVGLLNIYPGAVNSIPSQVEFLADIRDIRLDTRDEMIHRIKRFAEKICQDHSVNLIIETLNIDAPCQAAEQIVSSIETACITSEYTYKKLVSRAYHDSLFMAQLCPISMIFIPSKHGYSHRPEEYSSPAQIEKGVDILAQTLASLSKQ